MPSNTTPSVNLNTDTELQRTQRPKQQPSNFVWDQDIFRNIGQASANMTDALAMLDPTLKESFKQACLDFAAKGDYVPDVFIQLAQLINGSLRRFPASAFNTTWVAQNMKVPSITSKIGIIRRFFVFWKERDPQAISDDALQLLAKTKVYNTKSRNVLSDDPEKSWLSDDEYEALLTSVWRSYEDGVFSTGRTLILLLTMQYARRPIQLAHLKIKDFRIASPGDSSGLNGPVISFPGAKDLGAATEFRDSRVEHHPLPIHLWNLFKIQRNEIRLLFEFQLGIRLSDSEVEKLPIFTRAGRIETAVSILTGHFGVDWHNNLDNKLFHMTSDRISQTVAWRPNGRRDIDPPLSHRTGRPIVVSATRLRHTRARQLARKGVAIHVLSYWMGHTNEESLKAYYNDPDEDARKLNEKMAPALMPLAMAFAGNLIESEDQASRSNDPSSRLEFAKAGKLTNVGHCGKHSFCATTSVPIPCYRCRHFEPLVTAPHREVLMALKIRQEEENQALRIGGARNLLVPIDLSADILAVQNCINRCNARKLELGIA